MFFAIRFCFCKNIFQEIEIHNLSKYSDGTVRFKGPAPSLSFANPRVVVIVSNYAVSGPSRVWVVASGKAATARG